ncbi:hypothetical protein BDP67DRAFT_488212 [Colletotrichum lupini]|nr:hypothetical protein BDP67DRAFT_488212 [Colletotrichum lupini]
MQTSDTVLIAIRSPGKTVPEYAASVQYCFLQLTSKLCTYSDKYEAHGETSQAYCISQTAGQWPGAPAQSSEHLSYLTFTLPYLIRGNDKSYSMVVKVALVSWESIDDAGSSQNRILWRRIELRGQVGAGEVASLNGKRIPCFETQTAAVVPGTAPSCTRATRSNTLLSSTPGTTINHHQCHPLANANGFTIDSIASSIISTSISLSLPCIAPHGIPPPSASAYACTQTHRANSRPLHLPSTPPSASDEDYVPPASLQPPTPLPPCTFVFAAVRISCCVKPAKWLLTQPLRPNAQSRGPCLSSDLRWESWFARRPSPPLIGRLSS